MPLGKSEPLVVGVLISIVLTGLVGIPFGDPRFIPIGTICNIKTVKYEYMR